MHEVDDQVIPMEEREKKEESRILEDEISSLPSHYHNGSLSPLLPTPKTKNCKNIANVMRKNVPFHTSRIQRGKDSKWIPMNSLHSERYGSSDRRLKAFRIYTIMI